MFFVLVHILARPNAESVEENEDGKEVARSLTRLRQKTFSAPERA
jgi:hypothetical protein